MATIADVTQVSNYRGDPTSGGGVAAAVNIDSTPLQRLSQFNYYRDRDLWQQKLKDDAIAAQSIADIAAFDINSPLTQYSDALKADLAGIQAYVRDNPDALVYSKSPEKFQELNGMIGKFAKARRAATASDAIYNARKTAIDKEVDPLKRDVLRKELELDINDLFAGGIDNAYNQTLKSAPDLKIEDYQVPTVPLTKYDVIDTLPNSNITSKITFVNPDDLRARSEALVAGFGAKGLDENAAWFKALSPERQQIEREKSQLSGVNRRRISKVAADFNNAIAQVKALNPDSELLTPNTGIKIIDDNISWANAINDQIDDLNVLVAEGKMKDPTGRVISTPFKKLNLADGLSESEIVMMQTLQESKSPLFSIDKDEKQTDNAIQKSNIGLGWARLGEERRHNMATEANTAGTGAGNNLVDGNALNDITLDANQAPGVYNMTAQGNKPNLANISRLLGTTKRNVAGDQKDVAVLSLDDINSNNPSKSVSYEVELINGQPTVTRLQVGGQWYDREYFRNAQINLDKEPQKGQKTTYKTEQAITGKKKETPKKEEPLSTNGADWKQEGNNWRYKDGRLFDSNGKEIK